MKPYEITVTYRVYATDEAEATEIVLNERAEIETLDVYDLPTREKLEIDIVPF